MKKLLIALLFLIPLLSIGQRTWETDSLITAADTTYFMKFFSYGNWAIQFEYTSFDQDDWTLSLGHSQDGASFDKIDDARVPYTLDVTTNSYTDEAGNTRATVTFTGDAWRTRYIGFYLNEVTNETETDTLIYKWTKE